MENNKKEMENISILAYIGPLVVIPYLTSKNDAFVKFHVKQGLVLLCIEVIMWVIGPLFWWGPLYALVRLVNLLTLVLAIIGIINVVQKKEKSLPVVGGFSSYFKF